MKLLIVAILLTLSVVYAEDFYKIKHRISVDEILKSDRLLVNYFNCLTDKGTCTGPGLELKRIIPDALQSKCKKCSPKQKDSIVKAVKFLTTNKPEMWLELEAKYDPTGKFRDAAKNDPAIMKYNINF